MLLKKQAFVSFATHISQSGANLPDKLKLSPLSPKLYPKTPNKYQAIDGKIDLEDKKETKARVVIPAAELSDDEIAIIQKLPGGADLLRKLPNVDPNKQKSLIQEALITLDAIQRGETIEAMGKPILRTGKQTGELTEIDIETENEIIQVKGGDYSNKRKLDDEDLRQMTETKRYRERRANPAWRFLDYEGNELPTKAKKVIFHFTNPPVDPRLIKWLIDKDVEPRVGL
ncbi:hypothetical protein [Iningainema tapete]|uniref:Uncharacterized protein n=1 Tax=Iningainema tapete BLCC-T55 TaxID=2748662 RepID=A0A8J6XIQ2_9CYAN|nr:hypothetical protein [Iningainema tapete]MBD2771456.1 hypothetical protein [Iningainema tapete BLCC-T55]